MKKSFILILSMALSFVIACNKKDSAFLELSQTDIIFEASADELVKTLEVKSSSEWKATVPPRDSWLTLTQEGGNLILKAQSNPSVSERKSVVSVVSGGLEKTVNVVQNGALLYMSVPNESTFEFNETGGSKLLTVKSSRSSLEISSSDTWYEYALSKDGTLTITVPEFDEDKERHSAIVIKVDGKPAAVLHVKQRGKSPNMLKINIPDIQQMKKDLNFVYDVFYKDSKVAQICLEEIKTTPVGKTEQVSESVLVIYPADNSGLNINKGFVIDNGGSLSWDVQKDSAIYTPGQFVPGYIKVLYKHGSDFGLETTDKFRETTLKPFTVSDREGNVYGVTKIALRYWTTGNLKTKTFNNGETIPTTTFSEWVATSSKSYLYKYDSATDEALYGCLYNGYVISDNRGIVPDGWSLPSGEDFSSIKNYLHTLTSNDLDKGFADLKSETVWGAVPATNLSGFSAMPTGRISYSKGVVEQKGSATAFWGVVAADNNQYYMALTNRGGVVGNTTSNRQYGFAIRLVKPVVVK